MLDRHIVPILKAPLRRLAVQLHNAGVKADVVTVIGFVLGLAAVAALVFGFFIVALMLLLLNRLADGLDGEMAYAIFPIGFALYDPSANALAAALLVASFVGTGASFLAFDSFAQRRSIDHPDFAYKGFYYLNGLAEGTETIIVFVLMCLFPQHFVTIAALFALLCVITAVNRVVFSYMTLRKIGV